MTDNVWVFGNAHVTHQVMVTGTARISEYSRLRGQARVGGYVRVLEPATVQDRAHLSGNGILGGSARRKRPPE